MSIRVTPSSSLAAIIKWAGPAAALLGLAACAGQEFATGSGQLYARGINEISELYLEPVSSRRLAMAGAMR